MTGAAGVIVPRLGVSAGVWHHGRVLLVRRGRAPFAGLWSFPGGHVEAGEPLAEAMRREVREECGLAAEPVGEPRLLEAIRRDDAGTLLSHHVVAVFAARLAEGEAPVPVPGDDAAAAAFFEPAAIAGLDTTPGLAGFVHATFGIAGAGSRTDGA